MKINISLNRSGESKNIEYDYAQIDKKDRPMALDVLLEAQEAEQPGLAFRYGCRNGLCGVCTIDVNGKSKLACRTKLRDGDRLSAMHSLPVIKDLVVKRDKINQQLIGRLPIVKSKPEKITEDHRQLVSLNRCIECYACLDGCPVHTQNELEDQSKASYAFGNPYGFLKIQRVLVNPSASVNDKRQAVELAMSLGVENYDAKKVPGCGVGIDLKTEVIMPLLEACKENS